MEFDSTTQEDGLPSRGRDGRRSGLVNALRVFKLHGTNSALSSACRAALNSPTMVNFSARAALWSESPCPLLFLRTVAVSDQINPRSPAELVRSFLQFRARNQTTSTGSVQQHPGDQEEQLPASFFAVPVA